jgi:hypothetical protein
MVLLQFFRVGDWHFWPSALRCKRVTAHISMVFRRFPRCRRKEPVVKLPLISASVVAYTVMAATVICYAAL